MPQFCVAFSFMFVFSVANILKEILQIYQQVYSVSSSVWTVPSLCSWKFRKIRDDFDVDGQLDSIAPPARSNPTARRHRNHVNFFKIFMNIGTELSTLSMGHSIEACKCATQSITFYTVNVQKATYFYDYVNYIEWTLYVCTIVFAAPALFLGILTHEQWQCGIIAIFSAWFILLIYLQR